MAQILFTDNTDAIADEVNDNFTELYNSIPSNSALSNVSTDSSIRSHHLFREIFANETFIQTKTDCRYHQLIGNLNVIDECNAGSGNVNASYWVGYTAAGYEDIYTGSGSAYFKQPAYIAAGGNVTGITYWGTASGNYFQKFCFFKYSMNQLSVTNSRLVIYDGTNSADIYVPTTTSETNSYAFIVLVGNYLYVYRNGVASPLSPINLTSFNKATLRVGFKRYWSRDGGGANNATGEWYVDYIGNDATATNYTFISTIIPKIQRDFVVNVNKLKVGTTANTTLYYSTNNTDWTQIYIGQKVSNSVTTGVYLKFVSTGVSATNTEILTGYTITEV